MSEAPPAPQRDEKLPTPESLRLSISENWQHARHAQELRDRLNNLYWVSWGAVLAYMHVTASGSNPVSPQESALIFGLLALFSALVLSATLKWTAEFANHVAGVYHSSLALGLVAFDRKAEGEKAAKKKTWLRQILAGGASLPYPESVRGYMALPLNLPVIFNVGPAITIIVSVGLSISTGLCLRAPFGDTVGVIAGLTVLVCAVGVAAWVVRMTGIGIDGRSPQL